MTTPLIQCKNYQVYLKETGSLLLDIPQLTIFPHDRIAIVGASGAGKSTLLRAIAGTLSSHLYEERGLLQYRQQNLISLSSQDRQSALFPHIAFVLQDALQALDPYVCVGKQLLETYHWHFQSNQQTAVQAIEEWLTRMGLSPSIWNQKPYQLSGGMRQRIAMILALLAPERELLLADEPTTALDSLSQEQFLNWLTSVQNTTSLTSLYVTHDLRIASRISTQILVLSNGRVVESGSTASVLTHPQHPYTRALLAAAKFEKLQSERIPHG